MTYDPIKAQLLLDVIIKSSQVGSNLYPHITAAAADELAAMNTSLGEAKTREAKALEEKAAAEASKPAGEPSAKPTSSLFGKEPANG